MKKNFEVISEYDVQSDILYIHKNIDYKYRESVELGDHLVLDFSEDNRPVALEIIDASSFFNVKKFSLQHMKGTKLTVAVNDELICIKGTFIFPIHNKGIQKSFNEQTVNDINMPHMVSNMEMAEV